MVSVVMITLNHEKYITEAIEGVLMQETQFDIELIIADDASTDNTYNVVSNYLIKHPRGRCIKYFRHPKNLGMIPNFVWALRKCTGDMIALCEGDDYWTDPCKLQKQLDVLGSNAGFSGVFHETQVIIEPDKVKGEIYGRSAAEVCTAVDTISTRSLFHTSSFLFKRSCYAIPEWYGRIISADMALFSIVSKHGALKKIPEIMSVYRKHGDGITSASVVTNSFHQDRIRLIQYLNSYHNFKYQKKAMHVIRYHRTALGYVDNWVVIRNIFAAIKILKKRIANFLS